MVTVRQSFSMVISTVIMINDWWLAAFFLRTDKTITNIILPPCFSVSSRTLCPSTTSIIPSSKVFFQDIPVIFNKRSNKLQQKNRFDCCLSTFVWPEIVLYLVSSCSFHIFLLVSCFPYLTPITYVCWYTSLGITFTYFKNFS